MVSKMQKPNPIHAGMLSINSISNFTVSEVCFLISASMPAPIGTWYDYSYQGWTLQQHTCNTLSYKYQGKYGQK